MAAINFPTATSNGQTFEADTGVIYTYVGTPPNGFWSATFATTGLTTLDNRYIAKNDGNSIQTMQTQGLKFNNGTADTILLDGVNARVGIGTTTTSGASTYYDDLVINNTASGTGSGITFLANATNGFSAIDFADTDAIGRGRITYGHDADRLMIDVGGSERIRIDSSGKVGINTSSPAATLSVDALAGNATVCLLKSPTANAYLQLGNSSNDQGYLGYQSSDLTFYTTGTERMRINSAGRVGIATTPYAWEASSNSQALQVRQGVLWDYTSAQFDVGRNYYYDGSAYKYGSSSTAERIAFNQGNHIFSNAVSGTANATLTWSERMRITSSGNVGIGTTSPSGLLSVHQATSSASNYINITNNATGASSWSNGVLIGVNGTGDALCWQNENLSLLFGTNNTERMRIDSSGRLLLNGGTDVRIEFGTTGTTATNNRNHIRGDGSSLKYNTCSGGLHVFEQNGTERMRIDGTGKVGIGNPNPGTLLQVSVLGDGVVRVGGDNAGVTGLDINYSNSAATTTTIKQNYRSSSNSAHLKLDSGFVTICTSTSGTERFKVTATGATKCKGSGAGYFTVDSIHEWAVSNVGNWIGVISNQTSSSPYGLAVQYTAASPSNSANYFYYAADTVGAKFSVMSNGGVSNFQSNNSNLCDEREKKNIVSLETKWDKVKSWELKKFHYNEDADTDDLRYGVIAQQVETVCPEVLTEWTKQSSVEEVLDDDGNVVTPAREAVVRKGVKEQQMMWMSIKALQEAQVRIETIETGGLPITVKQPTSILNNPFASFLNSNGDTAGAIIQNGINSVTYATSSDYRLKDNVVDLSAAIPRLKQLAPKRFNFKADADVTVDGFLAHEAQVVVPEAVTGTHNQLDGDGNAIYQGIDQSKLVPLLTAALQEAIGRIETLETEVATLKGG